MKLFRPLFILSTFILSSALWAQTLRGTLLEEDGKMIFRTQDKTYQFSIDQKFQKNMDRVMLHSPNYTFEVSGDVDGSVIHSKRPPRVVGDISNLRGLLQTTDKEGIYQLGEQKAVFGRTKDIYTFHFDKKSREHYLGKEVLTHGHYEQRAGEKVFVINAILEANLISADSYNAYPAPKEALENPKKFVLKSMPKNSYAQSRTPFRLTLNGADHTPEVGESVLIITLSGRQGEEPGAAGGHFAIGMGEVQEDMSIKGETFNFYFQGPKEVLAGNTDLVSYFGHLIQGQQNYRPTFTLYAYGVDKKKLLKVRDLFEEQTHRVRTEKGLEITAVYNCTTTSLDTLNEVGIHGNHDNSIAKITDPQNLWILNPLSWGSDKAEGKGTISKLRQLSYLLKTDKQYFIPRNALESFVRNFAKKSVRKRAGIKRVDYVFIPQTPSNRPVGGISYNQLFSEAQKTIALKEKIKTRQAQEAWAKEILQKTDATPEQVAKAKDILAHAPTKEEQQREVDELLMKID